MINISTAIPNILSKLKKMPTGHYIELLTFKKDRSITMVKMANRQLLIIQEGFEQKKFEIAPEKLKKTLKTLLKKEFPRSHKVHLYSGEYQEP